MERAAIAPSLVTLETETGVPRVAPFIVDVPLPAQEAPPVNGTLVLCIGKLSANYPVTKEATVIAGPTARYSPTPTSRLNWTTPSPDATPRYATVTARISSWT